MKNKTDQGGRSPVWDKHYIKRVHGFEANYYTATSILGPNLFKADDKWLIELLGVPRDGGMDEMHKWVRKDFIVRIVPVTLTCEAYIVSEVWLGSIHLNRQFVNYEQVAS